MGKSGLWRGWSALLERLLGRGNAKPATKPPPGPRPKRFPCPCCGYVVFEERHEYGICPICFWEDDAIQLEFATTLDGGPNNVTLLQAQQNYASHGACTADMRVHTRRPREGEAREPGFRPIDPSHDTFEDWHDPDHVRASDGVLYYWRADFWRRRLTTQ